MQGLEKQTVGHCCVRSVFFAVRFDALSHANVQ